MRIAVVEQNGSGGLIHYAYQMCTALAAAGHDVTLITARIYELEDFPHTFKVDKRLNLWPLFDPSLETAPRNNLERITRKIWWSTRRAFRGLKLVLAWVGLTEYLLRNRPDIVQFGKINFPFEGFFLGRLKRGGLILTQVCHEFERRESSGLLAGWMDKTYLGIYQNFSAIFFHANQNRDRFHTLFNFPRERTHVIHHGNEALFLSHAARLQARPETAGRYGLRPGEKVVLFFGLISPSKGLPLLVEAFARIGYEKPVKLIIAGYPAKQMNMESLKNQVEKNNLADKVIFDTRYIPLGEVAPLVGLADMVVLPYQSSTQSGSLQVAYAFGRPVIATKVGGLSEAVEEGKSGFLVAPDDPASLAERIDLLLNDPHLAAEMGNYGRHLSETLYSWESVANTIGKVYEGLLDG